MRRITAAIGFLTLCVVGLGTGAKAAAETIQIAAPGFTPHVASAVPGNFGEVSQGLLLNAQGFYFAPVVFPATDQFVCRFKLIYRDNEPDFNVTARLLRKAIAIGGNAFTPPVVMATVASTGTGANLRRAQTAAITQPKILTGRYFYFVELSSPANTLEVAGVQIDVETTCP